MLIHAVLIAAVLPSFKARGQGPIYRSSLRVAVRKLDMVKPVRSFGDKDEWKAALGHLATAGVLTYIEASDSIVLRAAEEPEAEPMAE